LISTDSDSTHVNYTVSYSQEGYVHYVVDSVFAMIISIHELIKEKCQNTTENRVLCSEFFPMNGTRLLSILRNLSFHNGK